MSRFRGWLTGHTLTGSTGWLDGCRKGGSLHRLHCSPIRSLRFVLSETRRLFLVTFVSLGAARAPRPVRLSRRRRNRDSADAGWLLRRRQLPLVARRVAKPPRSAEGRRLDPARDRRLVGDRADKAG